MRMDSAMPPAINREEILIRAEVERKDQLNANRIPTMQPLGVFVPYAINHWVKLRPAQDKDMLPYGLLMCGMLEAARLREPNQQYL